MSALQDELDISLLQSDQGAFLMQCQNIVGIVVRKSIASGMFNKTDEEDIVQSVNEILFTKLPSIKSLYSGKSLLQTYVGAVIQNICRDLYWENANTIESVAVWDEKEELTVDPTSEMYFQDELERFKTIMEMYGTTAGKIILCLKIQYRLMITQEEIEQSFPVAFKKYKRTLMEFTGPYEFLSVQQSFELLAAAFNRQERKQTHWDSLRRWTMKKTKRIITLLNGTPPVRAHNYDSVKILLEEYIHVQTKVK
ncbi:MAG: hypothetical protein WCT99_08545 [Bacteroidota bacterium]|jgi:hypothetical protein